MQNIFNSVQMTRVKSNTFDLSHDVKMSLNMGELVPIMVNEVLPGDSFKIQTQSLLRMAPLIAPVMHKVDVYIHHFFVPTRLLWNGWEDFITGNLPADETPAFPFYANITFPTGSLGDYLGLPTGVNLDKFSAIPFSAYYKIYNEYYRDQNLIDPIPDTCVDGSQPGFPGFGNILKRAWQHDYFTSSLPWAQKGDPVTIPIGSLTDAQVKFNTNITPGDLEYNTGGGTSFMPVDTAISPNSSIPTSTLYADLDGVELQSTTINELRISIRLQEWLEKNARGGTRYKESLMAHFGVNGGDARLQRPEYIGGTKNPMVISEVLQTSESNETPQANMSGHGIGVGTGNSYNYTAKEHGYIMGIMSVMPRTAYQQGIPKHFSKFDMLDYAFPEFANLGEQPVINRELYYSPTDGLNDDTFGYVPRYAEYKYLDSRVAGDFRTSLAYWHMGRIFETRPSLNESFINCNPTNRIFAVEDDNVDKIYAHVFNQVKARRKLPIYGTPTL